MCALLTASVAPAMANTVDVTTNSQVTLGTNDDLIFYLSTDGAKSSHSAQYAGGIQILLGGMPIGGPVASIPGTSSVYMPGILFNGTLESQDGSTSVSLSDSNATRLGLALGDMLLTTGSRSGGSYSGAIDLLSAAANLGTQTCAALLGSSEVLVDLHNSGAPITFGYPGSTIASDFSASWISADGSQSSGARVFSVQCVHAPEPGTTGLLVLGLTILAARLKRSWSNRAALQQV